MKTNIRHLLPTALALMFLSNSALAETLGRVQSQIVMVHGEILGSHVFTVSPEDYAGDRDAAWNQNYTPEFNFVVRLDREIPDHTGSIVYPGIYYCRVDHHPRLDDSVMTVCYY